MSPHLYRMNVEEYDRLAEAGVLGDDRVELVNGFLVRREKKTPPHCYAVGSTYDKLRRLCPPGWCPRDGHPIRLPEYDEPEPDVAIVRGTLDDYRFQHPGPGQIALVGEVSESCLARDRAAKLAAYARAAIQVYWIVNLVDRQVEVYTDPRPDGSYSVCQVYRPGDEVAVVIAGSEAGRIAVADIQPRNAAPAASGYGRLSVRSRSGVVRRSSRGYSGHRKCFRCIDQALRLHRRSCARQDLSPRGLTGVLRLEKSRAAFRAPEPEANRREDDQGDDHSEQATPDIAGR
jgi:Uma2 family endonuclease